MVRFSRRQRLLSACFVATLFAASSARAACDIPEPAQATRVTLLANSFPVLQYLAKQMEGCSKGKLTVDAKLTTDVLQQARTMLAAGGAAPYAVVQVSNGSFAEFAPKGYLQPITDL